MAGESERESKRKREFFTGSIQAVYIPVRMRQKGEGKKKKKKMEALSSWFTLAPESKLLSEGYPACLLLRSAEATRTSTQAAQSSPDVVTRG